MCHPAHPKVKKTAGGRSSAMGLLTAFAVMGKSVQIGVEMSHCYK